MEVMQEAQRRAPDAGDVSDAEREDVEDEEDAGNTLPMNAC
jgi:hypothetical protein